MPFTYAHPAVIVPFVDRSNARGWRSALVLGAMSPDLARMIPVWGTRELSHSIPGLFLVDVPLAVVLALIWSIWFAPRAIRLPGLEAMEHPWMKSSRYLIPLGALIGGATHLVWDIFTHGPPVFHHPFLNIYLFQTVAGPFVVRDLNWFVHSFAGLGVLGWGACRLIQRSPRGLGSLLHPSWWKLLLAAVAPFSLAVVWIDFSSPNVFVDAYQVIIFGGSKSIRLLQVATILFFAVFWWETRKRGDESSRNKQV